MSLTKTHSRMIVGPALNVIDFGADKTGSSDSSAAVQAALDTGNNIYFGKGTYKVTNVNVTNSCIIDLQGSTILGDDGASNNCFNVLSDNVTIQNGSFGNGSQNCGIVQVGESVSYTKYKVFRLLNTNSNLAITNDKGAVALLNVETPYIAGNKFVNSGSANVNNMAVRLGVAASSTSSNILNVNVTNNFFDGYEYASRLYSTGYFTGFIFSENTVINGAESLSTYHINDANIDSNLFNNNSEPLYLWQETTATGNTISNSSGSAAVKIETNQGIFSNNKISGATGIGVIIDGGPSDMLFSNNYIYKSGSHAIYINPAYSYVGQLNSLRIESNFVQGCYGSAIYLEGDASTRSLYIKGNHINGAGHLNATQQPTILLDFKANFCDRLIIKDNVLTKSDETYNVLGNSDYGIYIDSDNISINYWVLENFIASDLLNPITDVRTSGGGYRMILRNLVRDVTAISATRGTGAIAGNYDVNGGLTPDAAS